MTEQEWLECTAPAKMLEHLCGKTSDRKIRLFAVHCCRRISDLLTDQRTKHLLDLVEQYANDLTAHTGIQPAVQGNYAYIQSVNPSSMEYLLASAVAATACQAGRTAAWLVTMEIYQALEYLSSWRATQESKRQVKLLREVIGNPFRPVAVDPSWLAPDVTALAEVIYDHRRFEDMPILADALEEAGCTNEDILQHCRGGGVHVRGCWVVDLLLAKE